MKIEKHYQDRASLNQLEKPYDEVHQVLNDYYMSQPGMPSLNCRELVDYYMMSCIRTIAEMLSNNVASFPSVLIRCRDKTYRKAYNDSMSFDNFYVNAHYEQSVIFGGVYYVLARQHSVSQKHLDYLEKEFTSNDELKAYFQPFKEALTNVPKNQASLSGLDETEKGNLLSELEETKEKLITTTEQLKNVTEQLKKVTEEKKLLEKKMADREKPVLRLKIHLAHNHKLDLVRFIKAMTDVGYFADENGQKMKPQTVANELLPALNYDAKWTSMLSRSHQIGTKQKSFEEIKKAFDLSTDELQQAYKDYVDSLSK